MRLLPGIFQTQRLTFWPFTESDFEQMRQLDTDPAVVKYLGHGKVRTEEETRASLKRTLEQTKTFGLGLYATHLRGNGEFIGRSGLVQWEVDGESVWEVGYTLAKAHWKKGLATEAAKFWCATAFEKLNVPFVVSLIHPENKASIAVATKCGMIFWKNSVVNDAPCAVYRLSQKQVPHGTTQ